MRAACPPAARLTDRHVRHLVRRFLIAGWCVRDLLHALDYLPDGTPHRYAYKASELRKPSGWITHRLACWTDQHGHPLPGARQRRQLEADAERLPRPAPATPTLPPGTPRAGPPRPWAGPSARVATGSARVERPSVALARDRALREQIRRQRLDDARRHRDDQPPLPSIPDQPDLDRIEQIRPGPSLGREPTAPPAATPRHPPPRAPIRRRSGTPPAGRRWGGEPARPHAGHR